MDRKRSRVVRVLDMADADDRRLADRLAMSEPVHPVRDTADLANRTDRDRRVFVLEHPSDHGRALGVVWIALWRGVPASIDDILDTSAPTLGVHTADTAAFYSIWNVERGSRGRGRGRTLIEGAVGLLRDEIPELSTFITLSPIPGFRTWLEGCEPAEGGTDPDADVLLRHCATYLTTRGADGRLLDPVARFHIGNGARLWRINPAADHSPRGAERSLGLMVNYRYEPEDRAANRGLLADGSVAVSESVRDLVERSDS